MAQSRDRRFIYNSDGSNLYYDKEWPLLPERLYPYIDEVADRKITSYFYSPNLGMNVSFPGTVNEFYGSNASPAMAEKLKPGAASNVADGDRLVANLRSLVEAGHDPFGVVLDRVKEKGLETFISFRMNEVHDVEKQDSLIFSTFWREHPEWRIGTPGEKLRQVYHDIIGKTITEKHRMLLAGWLPGGLNFAIPQVRERRLAEIRECCERYVVDGLDLDFQRFPTYFRQGEESANLGTMTDLVRQVRAMTEEIGRKRGRPFLLSARVLARPEQNTEIGLDPFTWAEEGLIDFLTAAHYLRNDFPLPVAEYRRLLPEDMPLYASIEIEREADGYRRIARQLWQDGADGIMLFNFFAHRERKEEPPFALLDVLGDPDAV